MTEPSAGRLDTRRSYDAVAREYAAAIGDELAGKPLDRALLDVVAGLAGTGPVADVGCGPGHVTAYLADRGLRPVGLDLSPGMCAVAATANPAPYCAADMTALPAGSATLAAIVSFYAVIHLDADQRAAAYREFARVLRPGGHALIAFHTSDAEVAVGGSKGVTTWWGHEVALTFRYLDAAAETTTLAAAGLALVARLDRRPYGDVEHPSRRTYLLVERT